MNEARPPHLLILSDDPGLETGFARVAQNLLCRWQSYFKQIDVWGIGYNGCPHPLPYRIWPAAHATGRSYDWAGNLPRMLKLLDRAPFTHVFIIQDPWHFKADWCQAFSDLCRKKGIHTTFYCPVDAPMRRDWVNVLTHVDLPVAYCHYGAEEIKKACGLTPRILPHGVDTDVYRPVWSTVEERDALRKDMLGEALPLKTDDILLLSVASHQKRKGLVNTLEIFERLLHQYKLPVKLFMHTAGVNKDDNTYLDLAAEQLGIPSDVWMHNQASFTEGGFSRFREQDLNNLYNCADVFISTSLGEGWGLPHCESVAAGVPSVFVPDHTSCGEIAIALKQLGCSTWQTTELPLASSGIMLPNDRSRVRYPTDVAESAGIIDMVLEGHKPSRLPLPPAAKDWLSWDRIAGDFLRMMVGKERL